MSAVCREENIHKSPRRMNEGKTTSEEFKKVNFPVQKIIWAWKTDAYIGTNLISKFPVTWHWKHHFIPCSFLLFGVVSIYLHVKQVSGKVGKKMKTPLCKIAACKYSKPSMTEAKSSISVEQHMCTMGYVEDFHFHSSGSVLG